MWVGQYPDPLHESINTGIKFFQLCWKCDPSSMIIQLPADIFGQYHDPLHKSIFTGIKMSDLCWKCNLLYDYISIGWFTVNQTILFYRHRYNSKSIAKLLSCIFPIWEFPLGTGEWGIFGNSQKNPWESPWGTWFPVPLEGGGEPRKSSNGEFPIYFLEILSGEKLIWVFHLLANCRCPVRE